MKTMREILVELGGQEVHLYLVGRSPGTWTRATIAGVGDDCVKVVHDDEATSYVALTHITRVKVPA